MSKRLITILILSAMLMVTTTAFTQDQYPPAGYDVVNTTALIQLFDPADSSIIMDGMWMTGRAVIYRGDPYDAGGGIMTIDTRMDTLVLRGYSVAFGDSIFAVLDRSGPLSTGQIAQITPGIDFPAESFFDVYYKLVFTNEPANPSPGNGPDNDATYRGSFDYDLQSQSGSMVSGKSTPFTNKQPEPRPAPETADKGVRQGGDDIGSAVYLPTIPVVTNGFTCDAADDYDEVCPYDLSTSPDVVYVIDPPLDTFITISTCNPGTGYDTKIYVYQDAYTPGAPVACNDDACPDYTSTIDCLPVLANSTYYIVIDGYGGECGDYELTIDYCLPSGPCVIECDAGFVQEQEACGDDSNGGCNMAIPTFEPIDCGADVCGTAWAEGGTRDTDWYEFTLDSQMTIELTGSANFPFTIGFVDTSDCALMAGIDPVAVGLPCDTQTVSRVAGPGTYYVFVAVNDFNNYPCGTTNDYFFSLRCSQVGLTPAFPPHMADTIWQIPPHGRVYIDPRKIPVLNADGDTVAWVWHKHVVDPPDAGEDTIPTIGLMDVWVGPNPPGPTQPADETIELIGEAIILRSDVYYNPLEQREIQTEILSMDLTGESNLFGPTILSLPFPAPGLVTSTQPGGEFFPAESFFDVYYQIDLPALGQTIEPLSPPRMQTTVEALPPVDNQLVDASGEAHPMHDVQNPGVIIGWVRPIHWVQPQPDTCEGQTPGDLNGSGTIDIGDLVFLTAYVDCVGPPPDVLANADVNGDCVIDQADLDYLTSFLYAGGPAPVDCTCVNPTLNCSCTNWLPGTSLIQYTSFQVDVYDPNNNTVLLGTAYAFGAGMAVQYNAPYEVSPDIYRMDVDILAFTGSGNSPLLGGAFSISLDPNLTSSGYIQMCDSCDDNWAESHFDINYRISTSLPFPDDMYYGNALMDLPCDEQWDPYTGDGDFNPPNGHSYVDPRKVPIVNENGEIIGYTMKRHRVDSSPLGACCEEGTGLCFIMTAAECEAAQGQYMGDNVGCDPNPCDTCTTGWLPGVDTIPSHDFEIELYDNTGTILLTTLLATGQDMIVQRGAPFQVSPGFFRMNTTITAFGGHGESAFLGGPFDVALDPTQTSGGYIQMCDSCNDNWAESYFDIYWVITTTLPYPMDVLTGAPAQMHLACSGDWDPWPGSVFMPPWDTPYNDPRIVPIYDASGQIIGYTRKKHTPRGPDGCCLPPESMRGDINCSGGLDISDLVWLVDYMFTGGPAPCCEEQADVNCSGSVDISDLVYLVDYMFTGGPGPCRCDCLDCQKSGEVPSEAALETLRKWSSQAIPSVPVSSCGMSSTR